MGRFSKTATVGLRIGGVAIMLAALMLVTAPLGPARGAERRGAPIVAASSATSGVLISVSCTSAHACMAVGSYDTSVPTVRGYTLAEAWNGRTWTIIPTRNPKSLLGNNLYGVWCTSAHACMAVGGHQIPHGGVPLAEEWNGKTWTVKATPKPSNDSNLETVSCASANACIATGFTIQSNANNWFSEAWNGKTWTLEHAPTPNGTTYSGIDGVSCASAYACLAVGNYQLNNSSKSRTLAETWSGRAWMIEAAPNPPDGVNGSDLNSVSCGSPHACLAVGNRSDPSNRGAQPLAEFWNGKTWKIETSRGNPSSAGSSLQSVSCPSARVCVAIGEYVSATRSRRLAETWNGKVWKIKALPDPRGATDVFLDSISCGSAHSCMTVGDYQTGTFAPEMPLVEAWNGRTWTSRTAPLS